ncbi:class I SAM-dependent methyltransferase [Lutispora sp.]|uniref:class I SAM-dependent methyltransferase n=1 Tax=Lutispora sp. TaxID=2828727 RepID=UPI00356812C4
MNKDNKYYTNQNREAWNEAMPKHQAASKEELDQLFSTPGYICQKDKNLLQVLERIDVQGKDVIHLCCNNGVELLSIKNMGANRCVGIDICDEAIEEAQERAKKFNIDCEFIRSDVYDISEELYNSFDIVHITAGCIGWIPDPGGFFKIISDLLRVNGIVLIHEIHPFSEMLPFDDNNIEDRLKIIEPYFRDEPIVENCSLDYVGGTDYAAKTHYWFVHTVSTLIMALVNNDLRIEYFSEYAKDISAGHKKQEELNAQIPLSYILIGKK